MEIWKSITVINPEFNQGRRNPGDQKEPSPPPPPPPPSTFSVFFFFFLNDSKKKLIHYSLRKTSLNKTSNISHNQTRFRLYNRHQTTQSLYFSLKLWSMWKIGYHLISRYAFFISNRFISNQPSDGKLLSNFQVSTLFH